MLEGCTAAQQAGLTVSCDLNYRSQLWSIAEAATAFARIVPLVDVLIANEEHARLILGAEVGAKYEGHDPFSSDRYRGQLTALRRQFDLSHVALTVRSGNTADETRFAAVLDDGRSCAMSRDYRIRVIDRVGAGDAFSGGLIYGLLHGWDVGRVVEFAAAAGCWKHTVHGDFSHASLDELLALVEHGQAGRVAR